MANKKYDNEDGVWRTIGGRRVFIKNGQSLADAMKESGKFKSSKKDDEDDKEKSIIHQTPEEAKAKLDKARADQQKAQDEWDNNVKKVKEETVPDFELTGDDFTDFVNEMKHNNQLDKANGREETVDAQYVIERLQGINTPESRRALRELNIDGDRLKDEDVIKALETGSKDPYGDFSKEEAERVKAVEVNGKSKEKTKEDYNLSYYDENGEKKIVKFSELKEKANKEWQENEEKLKPMVEKENENWTKDDFIKRNRDLEEAKKRVQKQYDDDMADARATGNDKLEESSKKAREEQLRDIDRLQKENQEAFKKYVAQENAPEGAKFSKMVQESGTKTFADEIEDQKKSTLTGTRESLKKVAENSKEDNVTLDAETGEVMHFKKGYSVSFQQSSDNYSNEEFDEKVNECKNKCDGKLYAGKYGGDAEPSFYTEDLSSAKDIMYKYNQESIYDWETDDYIYNEKYDTSKNKTNFEPKTTNEGNKEYQLPSKEDIAKEYSNYSKDLGSNVSKDKFAGEYAKNLYDNGKIGLGDFEQVQKDIKDSLKGTKPTTGAEAMNQAIRDKANKTSKTQKVTSEPSNGFDMRKYEVELKHDKGTIKLSTVASDEATARKMIMNSEGAPESAIVGVKDKGSILKENNKSINDSIREKAGKKKKETESALPQYKPITEQGNSNRQQVRENIQAHILDYFDTPEDFMEQVEALEKEPQMYNKWRVGERMAKDGFFEIYYDDQRKFLDDLKINPKGKKFSDDKVFDMYASLIGRETERLYNRLKKNRKK